MVFWVGLLLFAGAADLPGKAGVFGRERQSMLSGFCWTLLKDSDRTKVNA